MTAIEPRRVAMIQRNAKSTLPVWFSIAVAALCGALVAVQTRINGALGASLGDGFVAATISFGSGLLILTVCMLLARSGRDGLRAVTGALREGSMPFWTVLGGLSGAFLVLSQGVTAAVIGVAMFSVALVAGQTISGLMLDRVGFGPKGRVPLTGPRLIGAALAVVAVIWSVSGRIGGDIPLWMLVMPLIAGFGVGWQTAVNGRVRARARSALTATFINFAVGTTALVTIALVHSSISGWPQKLPSEPWLYIGGAIGCIFIGVNAFLVAHTGVLVLGLGTVAGQLIASVLLDAMLPGGGPLGIATVGGAILALVAVVIATVKFRSRIR